MGHLFPLFAPRRSPYRRVISALFFVSLHGGGPFCLVYVPPKRQAGGPSARLLSEIQQLNRGGLGNCAIHRALYQNLCSPLG